MIGGKVINDVFYENVSFRNYGCLVGMAVVSLEWQRTVHSGVFPVGREKVRNK